MNIVITTAIFSACLAFVLGVLLCIFRKIFHVETDVLVSLIRETLPGANCGACGFPGCDGFATACAGREADASKCTVSSAEQTKKRAELVGGNAAAFKPLIAKPACAGSCEKAPAKGLYTGAKSCRAAKIAAGGVKLCAWGCIGYGDCAEVCKFGAITMGTDGLPVINAALCKGCKICATECPQGVIRMVESDAAGVFAVCSNRNTIKAQVKKTCKTGCIKCGICVKKCPASALTLNNGIPETDYSKCTSCGVCVEACPQKVLRLLPASA
ncbi:MAG: RnfABCDGE type electron transport complex subunit B [Spirochaetaceae bacterium]|jgi:Na+-translocating ferredoxin:NAD+ oxidoreductase RNF subunit RnfB|nr:RnfABCDGE type electron transport complex subunit B [Spirochaetaceae bacterium]